MFKLSQCIFDISLLSPLRKGRALSSIKYFESPTSRMLCVEFGWNWTCSSGKEDFHRLSRYFRHVAIISHSKFLKLILPLIWTNMNSLHLRLLCVKFGWNWPSGSGEKIFYCQCIFAISFSPWKKAFARKRFLNQFGE